LRRLFPGLKNLLKVNRADLAYKIKALSPNVATKPVIVPILLKDVDFDIFYSSGEVSAVLLL